MSTYQNKIDKLVEKVLNEEIDNKVSLVLEKLKGGQEKLDVAEPKGKLTGADFKKLRQSKSKKIETTEEENNENWGAVARIGAPLVASYLGSKMGEQNEEDEEMEEGNAFSGALERARKQHKDSFEVDGETYPVKEGKEKWIQKTKMHKGALHKKLGIPEGDKIPVAKLKSLKKELQGKAEGDKKLSVSDSKLLKQVNLALNLKSIKESSTFTLTEDEMIDMIEKIVVEQRAKKEEAKEANKIVQKLKDNISKKYTSGLAKTEKVLDKDKKENNDYISSVTKKITDYLKGSKDKFEMNPTNFPEAHGQGKKDDTKAYHASDAVDEYIEAFSYPGMTNLVYDEIKPNDENIEMYIKGHRKTGNAEVDEDGNPLGNVVPSKVGERFFKNYKDNVYGAEQMDASYKRQPQPVDTAGEKTTPGSLKQKRGSSKSDKIFNKLGESENKEGVKINEEMEKMKSLISYSKKTQ
jgi:hypothetical protein